MRLSFGRVWKNLETFFQYLVTLNTSSHVWYKQQSIERIVVYLSNTEIDHLNCFNVFCLVFKKHFLILHYSYSLSLQNFGWLNT